MSIRHVTSFTSTFLSFFHITSHRHQTLLLQSAQYKYGASNPPGAPKSWVQEPVQTAASSKQKREDNTDDDNASVDDGAVGSTRKLPAKKVAKKSSATKPIAKAATKSAFEPGNTVKEVEKTYLDLDQKVKAIDPNNRSMTVATYVEKACKHTSVVAKLLAWTRRLMLSTPPWCLPMPVTGTFPAIKCQETKETVITDSRV
ncbi:hypothetical protein LTR62_002669 [Meristemomyces frigidus]|uniref:Uncharacterized protein n=1 Tax=Meristemomyces frigidus TaxID=1508187 RepID=A0AAN7TQK5_9PEZI|nr:hypothetical protein LTR62_002669 [Meristemomyces frigidus]